MTGLVRRFCPRCGTGRVADMPFCPGCGLDFREVDQGLDPGAAAAATDSVVPSGTSTSQADATETPAVDEWEAGSHDVTSPMESARSGSRGLRVHPIVLIAAIVVVVLVLVGLLPRPQLPGPGSGGPPASSLPSGAPIVGLTILSPTDGQAVAGRNGVETDEALVTRLQRRPLDGPAAQRVGPVELYVVRVVLDSLHDSIAIGIPAAGYPGKR